MTEFHYFPLVSTDTSDDHKVPMFSSNDERQVAKNNKTYLEEFLPGKYRLHQQKDFFKTFSITCPHCFKEMQCISPADAYNINAIYICADCSIEQS